MRSTCIRTLHAPKRVRVVGAMIALLAILASPGAATAQMGPDYWEVAGVPANDLLNIRSGPSTRNRVVATAPNGFVFRNLGCRGRGNARWCHIETPNGATSGWASGRYLREAAATTGGPDVPELHVRSSGEIEVRFASGCTVLYNPAGRQINAGGSCSRAQRNHAHDAVEAHFRENNAGDHFGGSAVGATDIDLRGTGTFYGGNAVTGRVFGHREGHYALTLTSGRTLCSGVVQHAPDTVRSQASAIHCTDGADGTAVLAANRSGRGHTLTFTLDRGGGGYVLFN